MNKSMLMMMNANVNKRLRFELRDKILDNMNLDDVPNLDIVAEYLDKLSIPQLLELNDIAEVLDWQLIGRTIGVVGETYKDKEV
jgi:hypothetical protein